MKHFVFNFSILKLHFDQYYAKLLYWGNLLTSTCCMSPPTGKDPEGDHKSL